MNDLLRARLAAQGGLVTAREAHSCGYTSVSLSRLVASGDLFRARAGCFVDGLLLVGASPAVTLALTARAVSRGYRPPRAISHVSALAVLGLPILAIGAQADGHRAHDVHLTLTGPGCPRTLRGLKIHPELPGSVARERDGGRVDFLFRKYRTVVEFDGLVKYGGADGRQALIDEKRREDALRTLGYQVVRLTWRDLYQPALVDRLIKEAFLRT